MSQFELSELRASSVWNLYRMRERIQVDPDYQRSGEIWSMDKRRLLIDTVLNGFDMPKIYLHKFPRSKIIKGVTYDYAIVDGRQRLETLWSFIAGKIELSDDFEYYADPAIKANGMTYGDLAQNHPDLKTDFDNFTLNIIAIETEEQDLIEEMFSRLNEAVPLSAAEKRNARPGPVPKNTRDLCAEPFFVQKLPFNNKRYRHFDLAVKFIYNEQRGVVSDTKKAYLDRFALEHENESRVKKLPGYTAARKTVEEMANIFVDNDPLLRSIGMVMLYFHLFRLARSENWLDKITRRKLLSFDKRRVDNRRRAEEDITSASYDLLEFDRYAQSPNDAVALKFRLQVILKAVFGIDRTMESL
ncbi:DUF262 domain-containing protein [Burkholderia cenocepacia]|uniref:DUF262 domain-containing protein n=1 Tax=Burkholderia cenocepacia TaxID=95486 RepID=UPI0024B6844B|nr:DUF262 domain-containing protein [Burkholderia cenocepacia]MDI9694980.1 DUF262 domain-containing protein [Burkholderia cenocepacia]